MVEKKGMGYGYAQSAIDMLQNTKNQSWSQYNLSKDSPQIVSVGF
jgi:hypothetical protein